MIGSYLDPLSGYSIKELEDEIQRRKRHSSLDYYGGTFISFDDYWQHSFYSAAVPLTWEEMFPPEPQPEPEKKSHDRNTRFQSADVKARREYAENLSKFLSRK